MPNKIPVVSKLKQLAFAAGIFGLMLGSVGAQTFGEDPDAPSSQSSPPASTTSDNFGEPGVPSITSSRPAQRIQQTQQQQSVRDRGRQRRNEIGDSESDSDSDRKYGTVGKSPKDTFGTYVATATGTPIEHFGKNFFREISTTYTPFDSAQVNGDYVIGTGDEIQIRGWGMINVDVTGVVDRNGAIYIPRVGSIKVAGVKYRDLQGHLKQAIGKTFNNFELTASIAQTRSLQIYVVGHALRPGTYTLNSMSTLLNALFTSGGPDSSGSMRNIQLKRGGVTVATFDLYDMIVKGDKSQDATLRDGDVVYIPEIGQLVALTGNVKTPAIFELKGPSSVADVLNWAGGVDSAADQKQIIVEKIIDNAYQAIGELTADKATIDTRLSAIAIRPTDVIRVFAPGAVPVQAQIQTEYVRVSGEVKKSGVFQIRKGETLRELMFRLGGSLETGYIYATELTRESVRRAQQIKLDEVATRFERDAESASASKISGTTDRDAIAIQAAEAERQRSVAQKLRAIRAQGRIVLELSNGNAQVKDLPDVGLQDGDKIFIPRKPGTVDVLGSVSQSNSFIFKPNRTVKDYVLMAGGGTASADTSEMYVIHADGTAASERSGGWFSGIAGVAVNPGDTIVMPEKIERTSWRQSLKEWTAIFYQFGLGAAGLKVLRGP